TNNPKKIIGLQGYGIEVVERVPMEIEPNEINLGYLKTKCEKMGHMISVIDNADQNNSQQGE
ncbi:MAG: bifunctional 3,4-dihydroxy-2-butanone-4-phosphate synthase/GTP cyclohydrolase II, partial [Deltaproteobacteria bacterium]|nr:bifunctional 3,4-dihydroxy-2-butanone-4-phosphate synthase/GTP cyclohydrolase II [Deltaproteobacteria bacterium]